MRLIKVNDGQRIEGSMNKSVEIIWRYVAV
jgi:hypothetical protein